MTDCLARYPEHAEELRPLLSLASGVRAVRTPRPDPVAVQANRRRMLEAAQAAAARRQQRRFAPLAWIWGQPLGSRIRPLYRASMALAAMVVLVALAAGLLFASAADSLPGQALYSVKRFGEDARLSLTLSSAARQELREETCPHARQSRKGFEPAYSKLHLAGYCWIFGRYLGHIAKLLLKRWHCL